MAPCGALLAPWLRSQGPTRHDVSVAPLDAQRAGEPSRSSTHGFNPCAQASCAAVGQRRRMEAGGQHLQQASHRPSRTAR